jgi:hypothetical protein
MGVERNLMKRTFKGMLALGALCLAASPALGAGPGTGDQYSSGHTPTGTPPSYNGSNNPGSEHLGSQPSPPSKRALGVVCARQGASKSNENDPEPGTPFSRCVKELAQSIKTACKGESKSNENDPEPGTPFSRCVRDLARGLKSEKARKAKSSRRAAKVACSRPDFESGREVGRCVRVVARALRKSRA